MSEYYLHRSYDCQLSPHASDILDWSSAIHRLNSVYQRYGIENNAHQNQNNSSKKKNRKDNVSYARNTALRNWEYPAERWKVQQNTTQMTQLEELLTKPNHSHSNNSVDTEDTLATTTDELSLKRALPAPINSVHQIIFTSLGDYPFYVRLDKNKKNKNKKQQQEEDTIIKTGVFRMYAGLGLSRVQRNDYFATALAETLKTQIDRNANKNNIEIGYRQLLYVLRVLDVIQLDYSHYSVHEKKELFRCLVNIRVLPPSQYTAFPLGEVVLKTRHTELSLQSEELVFRLAGFITFLQSENRKNEVEEAQKKDASEKKKSKTKNEPNTEETKKKEEAIKGESEPKKRGTISHFIHSNKYTFRLQNLKLGAGLAVKNDLASGINIYWGFSTGLRLLQNTKNNNNNNNNDTRITLSSHIDILQRTCVNLSYNSHPNENENENNKDKNKFMAAVRLRGNLITLHDTALDVGLKYQPLKKYKNTFLRLSYVATAPSSNNNNDSNWQRAPYQCLCGIEIKNVYQEFLKPYCENKETEKWLKADKNVNFTPKKETPPQNNNNSNNNNNNNSSILSLNTVKWAWGGVTHAVSGILPSSLTGNSNNNNTANNNNNNINTNNNNATSTKFLYRFYGNVKHFVQTNNSGNNFLKNFTVSINHINISQMIRQAVTESNISISAGLMVKPQHNHFNNDSLRAQSFIIISSG